ncbi:hypothetical protein OE88DRAFT_1663481 [Heliocybe sulcata]|uniref:Uncharacterized protein n=1 Tax=Heliocybe sulcata TaxID=5364 RepID=A0A5C3MUW6_9AGAM|nr:hypothetical protein OE88DRAFT_1663481 [Heliocybe sulcata]
MGMGAGMGETLVRISSNDYMTLFGNKTSCIECVVRAYQAGHVRAGLETRYRPPYGHPDSTDSPCSLGFSVYSIATTV